jgi:hypothetical protein
MKDDDKAAKYYEMYVQAEVEEDHLDQRHEGYSEAYFFLAQYYIEQKVQIREFWSKPQICQSLFANIGRAPALCFFLLSCFVQKDFSSGAPFARKCVWYIPTRDEGAKLLKKLPKKELFAGTCVNVSAEGDISRRPLSETLPSQDTSREKHEQLMSDSPKCKEKQQMDKFDNWSDFVKERILQPAYKVTDHLFTLISLKMAERSEAKSAKQTFVSKIKPRFALLPSLHLTIFR